MPRLTEQEWKRLLPLLRNIDINRQQAAYSRLVLGTTLVKAGAPFGYSMQDVHYIVKTVLRWWEKLNELPSKPKPPNGWVSIELVVPRNHVDDVRRVIEALYPAPKVPADGKVTKRVRASRTAGRQHGAASATRRPKAS